MGAVVTAAPNKPRGIPRVDDRRVISGIVHVLKSDCRWKDARRSTDQPRRCTTGMFARQQRACDGRCSSRWPEPVARRWRRCSTAFM
ncbi:transposase [Mycobacterium sp. KBS0706]|nr:transposase [Mycobacterium sp. KBS0706]